MNKLIIAEENDQYLHTIMNSEINLKARNIKHYKPSNSKRFKPVPNIVWMNKNADDGLPHTRYPNIICLPVDLPNSMLYETILHETVHIDQRLYPKKWENILKNWDMTPWYGHIPKKIKNTIRINPDIMNAPLFIWKERWVVLGVFSSTTKPQLSKISSKWWDVSTNKLLNKAPNNWYSFYGNISAEHPYEISAYYLAGEDNDSPACKILESFELVF